MQVQAADAADLSDAGQGLVVGHQTHGESGRQSDQLRIHLFDLRNLVVGDVHPQEAIAPERLQGLETSTPLLANSRVAGIRETLQLREHEAGHQ